jgi:hypothetical protein
MDLGFVLLVIGFFAITLALVALTDRLRGRP